MFSLSRGPRSGVKWFAVRGRLFGMCATVLACSWTLAAQRVQPPPIDKGPNTLFGRVLDAGSNAPVGGAQVTLFAYLGPAGPPQAVAFTTFAGASATSPLASAPRGLITDGDGEFFFGDLPAGRYAIKVAAIGYLNGGYLAPTSTSPAHLIDVVDNERPSAVVVRLVRGASISGTVVDDRGDPIVDAPVQAFNRIGLDLEEAGPRVRTDDRGAYRIASLQPGGYVVGVVTSARTIPAAIGAAIDANSSDVFALYEVTRPLMIVDDDDLTATGPGRMPTGAGSRVGDWVLQGKGPIAPPAPDGRLLAYATTLYPATAVPSEAATIRVGPGEERTGIDMAMRAGPSMTVSGVLMGPTGPVQNVGVQLRATHTGDDRDVSPTGEFTSITTAAGAFVFLGVPQGQYQLTSMYMRSAAPNAGTSSVALFARQPVAVGDHDVAGLTVTLKPGIHVSGRVEYRGAPPVFSGRVLFMLRPLNATMWHTLPIVVGTDGRFSSEGDAPGHYTVTWPLAGSVISITLGGRPLFDQSVVLESTDLSDLVVTVSDAPLHLTGSVVDATGAPAAHANVFAFPSDSTTWRQGVLSRPRLCNTAATTSGAFDCVGLSIGEDYVAAVNAETSISIGDPTDLERLVAGAARVTVIEHSQPQISLKLFTPKEP